MTEPLEETKSGFTHSELTALATSDNWQSVTFHTRDFYEDQNTDQTQNCTYRAPNGTVINIHPKYEYTDNGPVPLILITGNRVQVRDYDTYNDLNGEMNTITGGRVIGLLTGELRTSLNYDPVTDTLSEHEFNTIITNKQHSDRYIITPIVKRHSLQFPIDELQTAVTTIENIHETYTTINQVT